MTHQYDLRRRRPRRAFVKVIVTLGLVSVFVIALVVGATIFLERALREPAPSTPDGVVAPPRPDLSSLDLDYVALGDSYAAGPGLQPQRTEASACARSAANYPSLIAAQLPTASVRDVSCTGAFTEHVEGRQRRPDGTELPPQIDALRASTDLVTITLGGNDDGQFLNLVTQCSLLGDSDPEGNPCQQALEEADQDPLPRASLVGDRLYGALVAVRHVAPRAIVAVVGYPRLIEKDSLCDSLGFARGDAHYAARVIDSFDRAASAAAQRAGAYFIDTRPVAQGHDICSASPWFEGREAALGGAAPWHARGEYMQAVADLVIGGLKR